MQTWTSCVELILQNCFAKKNEKNEKLKCYFSQRHRKHVTKYWLENAMASTKEVVEMLSDLLKICNFFPVQYTKKDFLHFHKPYFI